MKKLWIIVVAVMVSAFALTGMRRKCRCKERGVCSVCGVLQYGGTGA